MNAVTILTPEPYVKIFADRLRPLGRLDEHADGGLSLSGSRSSDVIFLYPNPEMWGESSPEQEALYRSRIAEPVLYSMDFVDVRFCARALEAACDDDRLFVDNNFGLFVAAPEYVRVIRAYPRWDWVYEPPPSDVAAIHATPSEFGRPFRPTPSR